MSPWKVEEHGGMWYCVREGFRVPDAFLCHSESNARDCALALNDINNQWIMAARVQGL